MKRTCVTDVERSARTEASPRYRVGRGRNGAIQARPTTAGSTTEGDPVFDLAMELGDRPDALAVMGEAPSDKRGSASRAGACSPSTGGRSPTS